jgi:hypothetical protein
MTPEQHRAELVRLNAEAASAKTEAIAAQIRAYNPHITSEPYEVRWAKAEAAEEAWLHAMDLAARGESAYLAAVIERDRAALGLAVERYEDGEAVA